MSVNRLTILAGRVAEVAKYAPALARRLEEAGLGPADVAVSGGLDRLPVLSKERLMQMQAADPPFAGFLACDPAEIAHVFASPGPIFEPVLKGDATGHGMDRMFGAAGIGVGDVALNTWSYHLVPAGLLFDQGLQAVGATVIPSGPGQTELQCSMIATLGVTAFLGSTAYFETVAEAFANTYGATRGTWSLRCAFLGGEPGNWAAKRRRIEAEHGVTTHSCYATADLGLVGYEEAGKPGYTVHPERLVQICDPHSGQPLPEGEPGEVVVTTLACGWPMIRFGTGDLARALNLGPDGFVARMGPIEGRVGAAVKVREIFVYPLHARQLAEWLDGADEARIRIARAGGRDRIEIELTGRPHPEDEVIDRFRAISRLRADEIRWVETFTINSELEDVRAL
jgi:phenylacetate-CoA ligase